MSIMTRILDRVRREIAITVRARTVRMRNLRPIVSFSFDDFPKSAVTIGAGLLERRGVTGTFYYCRSFNGRTVDEMEYYNIDDLRRLVSNGHELGCHTASHILVSRYSRADLLRDIEENATYLREQVGDIHMTTFAFPFGDMNLGSKILLQERFAACRTTAPGLNHGSVDLGALKAHRLYANAINPEGVTRLIKGAAASNAWLIFYTHDVDERPGEYGCTPRLFEAALETALAEHCDILPVRNALGMIGFRQ
jgi:peptidoglycan/xylan/chitin deacetylase (PgdA/CDA1 family)